MLAGCLGIYLMHSGDRDMNEDNDNILYLKVDFHAFIFFFFLGKSNGWRRFRPWGAWTETVPMAIQWVKKTS